jgi:hypothetical protein
MKLPKNIDKSSLKKFIKSILKEVYQIKEYGHRFGTSGEWLEPNGTVHNVESKIHYVWADNYLKSKGMNIGKEDPMEYLYNRGWIRIIYSYNESIIMISKKEKLTRYQLEYLEDQSEETEWAVMDDDGYLIYKPTFCKTSEDLLQENAFINHNQMGAKSQCSGYSHDVTIPDITQMERDPLTDPLLTGKLDEQYKFDDFKWLARMDGFGMPTDVYYGSILLGVIISTHTGYMISIIKGPTHDISYKSSSNNQFKTKNDAAEMLHREWKLLRQNKETEIY